jgi:predicted RNA-binding protein YlxR (DUF448 family)
MAAGHMFLWHNANMPAKPVQVSIDVELLRRIDSDPETREKGRSAFVRSAVSSYLEAKRRRDVDAAIRAAYAGAEDDMAAEVAGLMDAQSWPRGRHRRRDHVHTSRLSHRGRPGCRGGAEGGVLRQPLPRLHGRPGRPAPVRRDRRPRQDEGRLPRPRHRDRLRLTMQAGAAAGTRGVPAQNRK